MNRIFISHKKEDSDLAANIAYIMAANHIEYYLDVLDPNITSDGQQLTDHLRGNLNKCTHLLVVLSEKTKLSWWVPFEIGLATEKEYPISTYMKSLNYREFPDYLRSWPVLKNNIDLTEYIRVVSRTTTSIINESLIINKSFTSMKYADAFHKVLKSELSQ